ncbi:unnamed protein product [Adineta ricciae]|uniref:G domain-containing protein n=1 Tax=Adineta ricciae TaxID=249248 RepID=A0A815PHT4_ADIRI|nr:unnamed protein product [Adineta ricciae]
MVYISIRAHCLAYEREWTKEYMNIVDLRRDVFEQFQALNLNDECALIAYFDEQDKCDRILDSLDILPSDRKTVFDVYLKRIWTCCCICFGPFDIIPSRLPLECSEKSCNIQYCAACVDIICELHKNKKFTCMFCMKTNDRPQRNILLENVFLWKPYTMRYGAQSTERLETIFNGPNLSDAIRRIESRRTHIQALQNTLKQNMTILGDNEQSSDAKAYLMEAEQLSEKLTSFVKQLRLCERNLKGESVTLRGLTNRYRTYLRDSLCKKPSKQEAASFILLCEKLSALDHEAIEQVMTEDEEITINNPNLIALYQADRLKTFVVKESLVFVNDILQDITYRQNILDDKLQNVAHLYFNSANHPFRTFFSEQHQNGILMTTSLKDFQEKFNRFRDIYNEITDIMREYRNELTNNTIDQHLTASSSDQMVTFECSRLILISELLRSETERANMKIIFPHLAKLAHQWEQKPEIDPKIYDLFVALEQDLLNLYNPPEKLRNLIPFRVGFIGNISVGKSSLVNQLRSRNLASSYLNQTLSPTAIGQSTTGSLEFNEQHRCPTTNHVVTIRYVDIEGYSDCNTQVQAASYFQQIQKANCDLYLILFTGQQNSFERSLEKQINERLNRPCWFVRSKIDKEFEEHFQEQLTRRKLDYPDVTFDENEENELAEQLIEMIREETNEICQAVPSRIFLVNSTCSNGKGNNDKQPQKSNYSFDLEILSEQLIRFAEKIDVEERIKRMAAMTCSRIIGTCFRQRCFISFISHQLRAGIGAALFPWGDQIALVHTRFGIRTAMGVQDRSSLVSRVLKKVDTLESLLLKYRLGISSNQLKSDQFDYLKATQSASLVNCAISDQTDHRTTVQFGQEAERNTSIRTTLASAAPSGAVVCGVVGQKVAAASVAVGSLSYGVGAGLLGLGLLVSIPIGVWKWKKAGKEIRNYLDDICSDLLIISEYFIVAIINSQINNKE